MTTNPRQDQVDEHLKIMSAQSATTADRETTAAAKAAAMAECDVDTIEGAGAWRLAAIGWLDASAGLHVSRIYERELRAQLAELEAG